MPPKPRFSKDIILNTALDLVREKGFESLTARALAERLNSSVKPIFSFFTNMGEIKTEVISKATSLYGSYIESALKSNSLLPYKATGLAYIRFAREESELFKLLFMRNRKDEDTSGLSSIEPIIDIIVSKTDMTREEAERFHLEMWIFVHGVATMSATSFLDFDDDTVSDILTDVFLGLKSRFKEKNNGSDKNS